MVRFGCPALGRQIPGHSQLGVVGVSRQGALRQLQRRYTVDQGMVKLDVDREAAVVEALDKVGLPQWAMPVEQRAMQTRRQLKQVADAARGRERGPGEVVSAGYRASPSRADL